MPPLMVKECVNKLSQGAVGVDPTSGIANPLSTFVSLVEI